MIMKRTEKYPDTDYFHYLNWNPKNRITGDCTFRAIGCALNMKWNDVVMDMAKLSCKTGYAINDKKGIASYLKEQGWRKMNQPKTISGKKFTCQNFCDYLNDHFPNGNGISNIVANVGCHHIVCIKYTDGKFKVNDIWNSSNECIGNYWVK